jgi:hypothetical protein
MQRRFHKAGSVAANALYAPQTASRAVAKSTPWPPFENFRILNLASEVSLPEALQDLVSRLEQDELDRRPGTV